MAAATQPTQQADAAKQVANIQRKLERWELTHLRALAASLHERLERTEAELAEARARIEDAWADADMWRDQAKNLIEDLQAAGREVGLTQSQLVTMPMPSSKGMDIDAVHKAFEPLRDVSQRLANEALKVFNVDNGYDVREGGAA